MGATHSKIRLSEDSTERIVNVAHLIPYQHFILHSSHVERSVQASIPNASLDHNSEVPSPMIDLVSSAAETSPSPEALLLMKAPSVDEVATIGTPLSVGPSPATVSNATDRIRRHRKFLLDRVWTMRRRLGIADEAAEPEYPADSTNELFRRVADLHEYTVRVIRLNRYLLAARDSPADLLPNHVVVPLAPLATARLQPRNGTAHRYPTSLEYLAEYAPLVPNGPLPTVKSLTAPCSFESELTPASAEDLLRFRATTDFSRMMDEPRVQHTYLPTVTGLSRGEGGRSSRPPSGRF